MKHKLILLIFFACTLNALSFKRAAMCSMPSAFQSRYKKGCSRGEVAAAQSWLSSADQSELEEGSQAAAREGITFNVLANQQEREHKYNQRKKKEEEKKDKNAAYLKIVQDEIAKYPDEKNYKVRHTMIDTLIKSSPLTKAQKESLHKLNNTHLKTYVEPQEAEQQ